MWEELHYYWHKINNLWKWEPRPDQLLQQIKTVLCCQKEDWSLAGSGDKAKLHMWHDNRKRPKASVPMCLRNNPVFSCQRDQWAFWTEHPPFPKRHLGLFWIMGLLRCKALYSRDFRHTSGTCISILWCTGRAVTQWACLWLSSPFPLPHPSLLLSRAFLFRLTSLLLWQSPIKLSSRAGWKAVFPVPWECRVLNIYVYYIYKTWFWSKLNRNFSQFFFFKESNFQEARSSPDPAAASQWNAPQSPPVLSGSCRIPASLALGQIHQVHLLWGQRLIHTMFLLSWKRSARRTGGFPQALFLGHGESQLCSAQFQQNKPGIRNNVPWEHFWPVQFSGINHQKRNLLAEGAFSLLGYLIHLHRDLPHMSVQSQWPVLI